ncbi:MAG: LCP family protein [Candidatus Kerfeldbacteria bacterium]|nr:LCP family protein [Candidatus Kerfeldbacteria bacterium]
MKRFFLRFLLILFLIIVANVGFLYFLVPERYTLLLIGSDQRGEERARSDVLLLVSLPRNPRDETILLTIPRDSRVPVEGELDKITHAYAYGERPDDGKLLGNVDLTVKSVEDFLELDINATAEFTFETFKEIVDSLGGAETSAEGVINGERALLLVRNRFRPGGDFARTADQREIFLSLVRKMNWQEVQRLRTEFETNPELRVHYPALETYTFGLWYILLHRGLTLGETREEVIPGHGETLYSQQLGQNAYFWIPDEDATRDLIASF